jgi:endonuclease-3
MSASNRAKLIGKLHTALKKHYKPLPAQPARPLLEHVLYGSLLEDSPSELADEGIAKCEQEFFDWNEVRVTTVTELSQVMSRLPEPMKAARRLKSNLQAIFEEFYTFDLDHLKKENLGKAVAKFERMPGMTPFVLSYTVQHGLGGHSIPIDYSAMVIMLSTEITTQPEAMAGKVPGLERAIPKNKGAEFGGLLHQCAVALNKNVKDKTARTVLDQVSKGSSERLDLWIASKKAAKKRVVKRKTQEMTEDDTKTADTKTTDKKKAASGSGSSKGSAAKQPAATKKAATKKAAAKKSPVKKETKKKTPTSKKTPPKPAKKAPTTKKATAKTAKKTAAPKKTASKAKKATKSKATKKTASTKSSASKKTAAKKSSSRKLTKRKPR